MLISTTIYAAPGNGPYTPDKPNENISSSMSTIETRIRQAAVRVTVPFSGGHGSGSYIKYKDVHLVFTAQHVSDGPLGVSYLVTYKQIQ